MASLSFLPQYRKMSTYTKLVLYIFDGTILIPTVYRADNGFDLAREPVLVLPLADRQSIVPFFAAAIAMGNPPTPTPPREELGKAFIHKYSTARSNSEF